MDTIQPFGSLLPTKQEQPANIPQVKEQGFLERVARRFGIYDYLIKPVYNVAQHSEPAIIPFDQDLLTATSITFSTSTLARTSVSINGTTYYHACNHSATFASTDTGLVTNEGDNTQYDRLHVWFPDLDMLANKISVNTAFGLNVSAYTSGNFSLTSVRLIVTAQGNNYMPIQVLDRTYLSGLGNLTATGTQIFIVDDEILIDQQFFNGQPVIFNWIVTATTGVGTSQQGVVPWHPYVTTNAPKTFGRSEIKVWHNAAISHGDRMLRQQANNKKIDYTGLNVDGEVSQ